MQEAALISGSKPETYDALVEQAGALLAGEHDLVANAANLVSLVYHSLPDLNWVGLYLFDGRELVVGPFQGQPACVRIAFGKGVCGTAAATLTTQVVEDVNAFPGHIACDARSRSEIVIPLVDRTGALVGVLDVDSPLLGRFDAVDRDGMERLGASFLASLDDSG